MYVHMHTKSCSIHKNHNTQGTYDVRIVLECNLHVVYNTAEMLKAAVHAHSNWITCNLSPVAADKAFGKTSCHFIEQKLQDCSSSATYTIPLVANLVNCPMTVYIYFSLSYKYHPHKECKYCVVDRCYTFPSHTACTKSTTHMSI